MLHNEIDKTRIVEKPYWFNFITIESAKSFPT